MNGSLKSTRIVILLLAAMMAFSSCGGSQTTLSSESESESESETPTTPSDPTGQEETPNVPAGYDTATEFFVTLDALTSYPHYVSILKDPAARCKIANNTTSRTSISCVVDAPELGFYFGGAELALNVPSGMCEYTRVTPYWYYNHETGYGPTAIAIETTTDAEGNLVGAECGVNGGAMGSCGASYSEVYFTGDGVDIKPKCSYDTTTSDGQGQNCCLGSYTQMTTTITLDASGNTAASTTSTSINKWGDSVKNCIGGQGKTNWEIYSKAGYPGNMIMETRSSSKLKKFVVTSPILTTNVGSNITLANYYTSSATATGASDEHAHTGFYSLSSVTSVYPYYVTPISDRSGDAMISGSPAYQFACLDDAYELKHRITLYLREWDTYEAYTSYVSTGVVSGAKPWDITPDWLGGDEGPDCSGLSPEVCNDYRDADNFVYGQDGSTYSTAPASATSRYLYFPREEY